MPQGTNSELDNSRARHKEKWVRASSWTLLETYQGAPQLFGMALYDTKIQYQTSKLMHTKIR